MLMQLSQGWSRTTSVKETEVYPSTVFSSTLLYVLAFHQASKTVYYTCISSTHKHYPLLLYLLWIHTLHWTHLLEFLPPPFLHVNQGHLPEGI